MRAESRSRARYRPQARDAATVSATQPPAAGCGRRRSSLVSGLLLTRAVATHARAAVHRGSARNHDILANDPHASAGGAVRCALPGPSHCASRPFPSCSPPHARTVEPLRRLYTEPGVVMVLAQVQMPLMVLPILTVLSKIDPNLADASRVLGAGEWRTLWRVTVPLSLPGVIAGCILTYSACVTAFVTQTLIGGARPDLLPLPLLPHPIPPHTRP